MTCCPKCGHVIAAPAPRLGGLTARQQALLDFIVVRIRNSGIAPTFEEMRKAVGLANRSGVARILDCLEDRGRIRRIPNRARAIELVERAS